MGRTVAIQALATTVLLINCTPAQFNGTTTPASQSSAASGLPILPQTNQPISTPVTTSGACAPEMEEVYCSVNGVLSHVTMSVGENGAAGSTSSAYVLPQLYSAVTMNVMWTCENNYWTSTDSSGECVLDSPIPVVAGPPLPPSSSSGACAPLSSMLLCSVNGVLTHVSVLAISDGTGSESTSDYILPAGFSPGPMDVSWTCNHGEWVYAFPEGSSCTLDATN